MTYTSITFIFILLPIFVGSYYLAPKRLKNTMLVLSSLFFYAWGQPIYVILLILSILINYIIAIDQKRRAHDPRLARNVFIFGVTTNILILFFFKYYAAVFRFINLVFDTNIAYRDLPMPIGLAIFTLLAISYQMDVYRRRVPVQRNIIHFSLYLSFFPQLLAGPIHGYAHMEDQLHHRNMSFEKFGAGSMLFIFGYAKIVILANRMADVFVTVRSYPIGTFAMLTAWFAMIAFGFYLYFLLSGFADIASGLAKMFGFDYQKNFNYPFTAKGMADFWRRWFISIGDWMRDYVFLPLYEKFPTPGGYVGIFVLVWVLIGIWHGSTLNFLIWGLYHLALLLLHEYVFGDTFTRFPAFVQHIVTFVLVTIGWVFFAFSNLGDGMTHLQVMFGAGARGIADSGTLYLISSNWFFLLLAVLASSHRGIHLIHTISNAFLHVKVRRVVVVVIYMSIFLISTAYLVSTPFDPLALFRF